MGNSSCQRPSRAYSENNIGCDNTALLFIKPHAVNGEVKKLVTEKLGEHGIKIVKTGDIAAEKIDKEGLIDKHYGAIASRAMRDKPADLVVQDQSKEAFSKVFGTSWQDALDKGLVYNAADGAKKLGIEPIKVAEKFNKLKQGESQVKLGGGFYVGKVDDIYIVNGFYTSLREKFTTPGSSIHYMVVEWDSTALSWSFFRSGVIGATNPKNATDGSIRRHILDNYAALGLKDQPDVQQNGVHASASPFEALCEKTNWLGSKVEEDPMGDELLRKSVPESTIKMWMGDCPVEFNNKILSLFDLLEDLDYEPCMNVVLKIAKTKKDHLEAELANMREEVKKLRQENLWYKYDKKLKAEGLNAAAIAAFKYNFEVLASGADTMLPESSLKPVDSLPELEKLGITPDPALLKETVMLKLNGGLGTGMGLDKAKSLLEVTEGNTFLDLIAKQVKMMRESFNTDLAFMLMNSFSTSADTLGFLAKYPELGTGSDLEFVQNKAPKVNESDYSPASWPADPSHEWCPPGHGDLYPAMLGSGTLDRLLGKGFKYMFVSNSDNLGAVMDLKLLTHFVESKAPFMMEVATRTEADKKGGHLARDARKNGLLLRETAQCPEEEEKEFQNINKYKYFNTNNLWLDLQALKAQFDKNGGSLPLPVMKNSKTVDPRDKKSLKVLQLETAMGAAIECFEGASAILIPRSRFAPVKTTSDLFALRSDAYLLTKDFRIELAPSRKGVPPNIKLDGKYKFVDAMETMIPNGVPSLVKCNKLVIEGDVVFAAKVVIEGDVTIQGPGTVKAGTYKNKTVKL